MVITQDWSNKHEELLGRLAACREDLTDISEGADLEDIETDIDKLESSISSSNEAQMERNFDEEEDEGEEHEGDEDEEEEEDEEE